MQLLKKSIISVTGGFLILLGMIFIIIPGPSLLLIIPGLFILSYEYPAAKSWLRKCMKLMRKSAEWLDRQIKK